MAAERSSPTQFDMQEQIDSDLDMYLTKTFADAYGADIEQTEAIDRIQRELKCCGVSSFSDWLESSWYKANGRNLVPDSCCKTESPGCGVRDHPSNIPYTGCIHQMSIELRSHLVILGAVGLGVALLQVVGVILTSCLFARLHRLDKYSPVSQNQPLHQHQQHQQQTQRANGHWRNNS